MNVLDKKTISKEAEMQLIALKKINTWKIIAIAFSTLGVAITYAAMAAADRNLVLGILGVIIIVLGIGSALVLNLGLKNGRRNIEKMLNQIQGNKTTEK